LEQGDHLGIELGITIQGDVTIGASFGKGLTQLLDDPLRSRVSGHVEMQNLPPSVLDDEEAVQHLECQSRYGEKVERSDHLLVIGEEGQETFAWIAAALDTLQIPATVRSETTKPSFWSSPWILGAPQVGFSSARRRMSTRISAVAFGLPERARDCHFQKSRNPARCQPTTVSGFTATRTSAHRDQMQCRVIQISRSKRFNRGRGRFRLRRTSCCRKARISRAVSFRAEENSDSSQESEDELEHEP
jgi:hypothetical protein